jgi:hypothetical protein
MSAVAAHYDRHLGPVYSWMLGGPEAVFARAKAELQAFEVKRGEGSVAIDLGAGFGSHATLTHLPTLEVVERLLSDVRAGLKPGDRFIVTLRG